LELANAARANANLATTPTDAEITGVDLEGNEPVVVSDDEDEPEEGEEDDEIEFMGNNLQHNNSQEVIDVDEGTQDDGLSDGQADHDEADADIESDEDSDDASDRAVAGARRSKRKRVPRQMTTFDFSNKTYQVSDGVIHINPAAIEQTSRDFKTFDLNAEGEKRDKPTGMKMAMISPRTAGVTQEALNVVSGLSSGAVDEGVSDGVVMHVMGVILAQQYSVNKGIKLFGDRAKEAISKELQQLHDYETYTP
jgi:hypothetical protein